MSRFTLRAWAVLVAAIFALPELLPAQIEDTTVWQNTGRGVYRDWARRDSAVARSLYRNLQRGDFRFLNVPDYGDGAIGMYTPAHDSALAIHGVRFYADSDLTDESVRAQKYYEPYHFAEYYNQALFAFVSASATTRQCYMRQATPFGVCSWTPLPRSATPRPERPLASIDSSTLEAMLDAALTTALAHGGGNGPVALDAEFGWDGTYSLARKGRHPEGWLSSILRRHLVTCVSHSAESPPCPATGPLTTIALNQPRMIGDTAIVIYTMIRTVMTQEAAPHSCGWGCFFGVDYDARLVKDGRRYKADPMWFGYLN